MPRKFKSIESALLQLEQDISADFVAMIYEYSFGAAKAIAESWANEVILGLTTNKFGYPPTGGSILLVDTGTMIQSLRFKVSTIKSGKQLRSSITVFAVTGAVEPRTGVPVERVLMWIHFGVRTDTMNIPERPFLLDSMISIGYSRVLTEAFTSLKSKVRSGVVAQGYSKPTLYTKRALGKTLTAVENLTLKPKQTRPTEMVGRIIYSGTELKFIWESEI